MFSILCEIECKHITWKRNWEEIMKRHFYHNILFVFSHTQIYKVDTRGANKKICCKDMVKQAADLQQESSPWLEDIGSKAKKPKAGWWVSWAGSRMGHSFLGKGRDASRHLRDTHRALWCYSEYKHWIMALSFLLSIRLLLGFFPQSKCLFLAPPWLLLLCHIRSTVSH